MSKFHGVHISRIFKKRELRENMYSDKFSTFTVIYIKQEKLLCWPGTCRLTLVISCQKQAKSVHAGI